MDKRIELLGLALFFVVAALYATVQLVSGVNFFSAVKMLIVLSPFILALISASSSMWLGIGIGLLPFAATIEVPILNRLSLAILFSLVLVFFVFAQVAIKKENNTLFKTWQTRAILASGALIVFRFAYDRPGSLALGGTGGGGQAVIFVVGAFSFWAYAHIAAKPWDAQKNIQAMIVVGVIAYLTVVSRSFGLGTLLYNLFHRTGWLLMSALLAYVFYLRDQNRLRDNLWLYSGVLFVLFIAALSPHRSRPVMAVAMAMSVAYVYRRFSRTFIFVALVGFIGIGGLITFFPSKMPLSARRSLSVFIPTNPDSQMRRELQQAEISDEMGWESDFRSLMYSIAWHKIKRSPIVGTGFRLSFDDFMQAYYGGYAGGTGMTSGKAVLAVAGGYHNSLLAMAVFCGLPSALFFLFGMLKIYYDYVRTCKYIIDPKTKYAASIILGFAIASTGQMLMNGSGQDYFVVSTFLGIMTGMMSRKELYEEPAPVKADDTGVFVASNRFEKSYRQYYY